MKQFISKLDTLYCWNIKNNLNCIREEYSIQSNTLPPLWENRRRFPFEHDVSWCFVCCQRPQYFYKKQIPPPDKARYASVRSCKYYTNPLQILYKYYTNTIQIHTIQIFRYIQFNTTNSNINILSNTIQILYKYHTNTIQILYRYIYIYIQIQYKYHKFKYQYSLKYYTNTIQIRYKYHTNTVQIYIYIDTIQIPQIQISIFFYCTKDNTDIEIQ